MVDEESNQDVNGSDFIHRGLITELCKVNFISDLRLKMLKLCQIYA